MKVSGLMLINYFIHFHLEAASLLHGALKSGIGTYSLSLASRNLCILTEQNWGGYEFPGTGNRGLLGSHSEISELLTTFLLFYFFMCRV